jgi:hypothetical protein
MWSYPAEVKFYKEDLQKLLWCVEYSFRTSERHQNSHFQSNIQSSKLNFAPSAYRDHTLPVLQADDNFERLNESLTVPESSERKGSLSSISMEEEK